MKIVFFSDTHGQHEKVVIPTCDILIFCGDFSRSDSVRDIQPFVEWFSSRDAKHKILMPGNHDEICEKAPALAEQTIRDAGINYPLSKTIDVEGIKIYGMPYSPTFCNWAFMLDDESHRMIMHCDGIPDNVDILVTHCPPYGILDEVPINYYHQDCHAGGKSLLSAINRSSPKIHCFGHIHAGHGSIKINDTLHINCSILNDQYRVTNDITLINWNNTTGKITVEAP